MRYVRRRHQALRQSSSQAQQRNISHLGTTATASTTDEKDSNDIKKDDKDDNALRFDPRLLGAVFAHAALSEWVSTVKETLQLNDLFYCCMIELDWLHPNSENESQDESEDIDDEKKATVLYNLVQTIASNAEVSSPEGLRVFLEADDIFVAGCRHEGSGSDDEDSVLTWNRANYWQEDDELCKRELEWNNTLAKLRFDY
ncbi:hypothetical protein HK102_007956 [Quaeritorhiza haematococci]|nr:hypothetical protein HK102_007956 [Quaeritorhiza haematococci]